MNKDWFDIPFLQNKKWKDGYHMYLDVVGFEYPELLFSILLKMKKFIYCYICMDKYPDLRSIDSITIRI